MWTTIFLAVFDWRRACGDTWGSAFRQAATVADWEIEHG